MLTNNLTALQPRFNIALVKIDASVRCAGAIARRHSILIVLKKETRYRHEVVIKKL